MTVGIYTATLRSARRREALRRPQREERGGGILWRLPHGQLVNVNVNTAIVHGVKSDCSSELNSSDALL